MVDAANAVGSAADDRKFRSTARRRAGLILGPAAMPGAVAAVAGQPLMKRLHVIRALPAVTADAVLEMIREWVAHLALSTVSDQNTMATHPSVW